jgi:hypothetical protein
MPVSVRKYTELKLAISDYLQRRNWARLFELCGKSDDETAKTIAVILTFYDSRRLWSFLEYVSKMPPDERREKRDSVATCCFILGKMGQSKTEKALGYLKKFLSDDHMLRGPVGAALSNLWVLDTKSTARIIWNQWVLGGDDNDDLQELGVKSSEYLAKNAPEAVAPFLLKVAGASEDRKTAARTAEEILEVTGIARPKKGEKITPKIRKKSRK